MVLDWFERIKRKKRAEQYGKIIKMVCIWKYFRENYYVLKEIQQLKFKKVFITLKLYVKAKAKLNRKAGGEGMPRVIGLYLKHLFTF